MGLLLVSCRWWRFPVEPLKARTLDHTKLRGKNRAIYPVTRFTKGQCAAYTVEEAKGHYGPLIEIKKGERKGEVNRGWPLHQSPAAMRSPRVTFGRREWRNRPLVVWRDGRQFRFGLTPDIPEGKKLVLPGTWTFVRCSHDQRPTGWQFTETPKRKARLVPSRFRSGCFHDRRHNLPAWRGGSVCRVEAVAWPNRPPEGVWTARTYRIEGKVRELGPASFDWKPDRQHYFGAWEQVRYVRRTRTPRSSMANLRHFIRQKSFLQHRV
jgi:hypothetical protein